MVGAATVGGAGGPLACGRTFHRADHDLVYLCRPAVDGPDGRGVEPDCRARGVTCSVSVGDTTAYRGAARGGSPEAPSRSPRHHRRLSDGAALLLSPECDRAGVVAMGALQPLVHRAATAFATRCLASSPEHFQRPLVIESVSPPPRWRARRRSRPAVPPIAPLGINVGGRDRERRRNGKIKGWPLILIIRRISKANC